MNEVRPRKASVDDLGMDGFRKSCKWERTIGDLKATLTANRNLYLTKDGTRWPDQADRG